MQNDLPTPGHNNPPSDAEILAQRLSTAHAEHLKKADDLIAAVDRVPETFDDAETAGKITDLIKMMTGSQKNLEAIRVQEKEPFLTLGRQVDGFFKEVYERVEKAKIKAQRPLTDYLKREAEKERIRREEEAKRLRLEAEEKLRLAAEAETANMPKAAETGFIEAQVTNQQAQAVQASVMAKPAALASTRTAAGGHASLRTVWVGNMTDRAALDLEQLRQHLSADAIQTAINSFVRAGGRELRGAHIREESTAAVR